MPQLNPKTLRQKTLVALPITKHRHLISRYSLPLLYSTQNDKVGKKGAGEGKVLNQTSLWITQSNKLKTKNVMGIGKAGAPPNNN